MTDKLMDCGKVPSDTGCTLRLVGREPEVLEAAVAHAVAAHGHADTPELHEQLRTMLEDVPTPGYVQIIEFSTDDPEGVMALHEEWLSATVGRRTVTRDVLVADRDQQGRYLALVEFPDHDAAQVNDQLDATTHFSEQVTKLVSDGPTFRNLDVVRIDT